MPDHNHSFSDAGLEAETDMTDAKTPSVNLSPSDYVIIGGTGDLALRKILPALFWRYLDGQITSDYRIAAASRRDISPEDYAGMLRPFCEDAFSGGGAPMKAATKITF